MSFIPIAEAALEEIWILTTYILEIKTPKILCFLEFGKKSIKTIYKIMSLATKESVKAAMRRG